MHALKKYIYIKYNCICSFQILIYFDIYQLCGKHERFSTKQKNLTLFEKKHVNALSLQNNGYYFVDVLRKELCVLEWRKIHTKMWKKYRNLLLYFSLINMEKCLQHLNGSVFQCKAFVLNSKDSVSVIYG